MPSLAGELMHYLAMVLRIITSGRTASGELDDAPLAVTPHMRVTSARSLDGRCYLHGHWRPMTSRCRAKLTIRC